MNHCLLHHVAYVTAKFELAMVKEMHFQENTLFELDLKVKGSRSLKMLPSTLYIM